MNSKGIIIVFCLLLGTVVLFGRTTPASQAAGIHAQPLLDVSYYAGTSAAASFDYGTRDCRYGVVSGYGNDDFSTDPWMDTLEANWYVNFRFAGDATEALNHVSMVRIQQDYVEDANGNRTYLDSYTTDQTIARYQQFARNFSGQLWVIGNEPDRGAGAQDRVAPELYARAYHEIREGILAADPTARFANAGLVQVTPTRLQYLDTVFDTYQSLYGEPIPVDVWTIHVYILPELEPASVSPDPTPNGIASVALGSDPALGIYESGFTTPDLFSYVDPEDWSVFVGSSRDNPPYIDADDLARYKNDLAASRTTPNCNSGDPTSAYYNHVGTAAVEDNIYCTAEHDDVRIVQRQIETMRQWMADHGQRDKPLIITEMGSLWYYINDPGDLLTLLTGESVCSTIDEFGECFDEARVARYLEGVNDYLLNNAVDSAIGYPNDDNRLVQQWAWFSVYQYKLGPSGQNEETASAANLIKNPENFIEGFPGAFTEAGKSFQTYATANTLAPDVIVDVQPAAVAVTTTGATQYPITLEATVRNTGNTSIAQDFRVTFYADAALTDVIAHATMPAGMQGCSVEPLTVMAEGFVDAGVETFYTVVDTTNALAEDAFNGENNNVYSNAAGNPMGAPISFESGGMLFLPVLTR